MKQIINTLLLQPSPQGDKYLLVKSAADSKQLFDVIHIEYPETQDIDQIEADIGDVYIKDVNIAITQIQHMIDQVDLDTDTMHSWYLLTADDYQTEVDRSKLTEAGFYNLYRMKTLNLHQEISVFFDEYIYI